MSKIVIAILAVMMVASCGGGRSSAPKDLDDACKIVKRPGYKRAFTRTERRWGVPVHVQMAVIYQESKFVRNARTPHRFALGVIPMGRQSSAFGYSQALDSTWKEYKKSDGRALARRTNIADSADFMGWYMNRTRKRNGVSLHDARNQYLAYHEGHVGFARGRHNRKSWLLAIANDVERRSGLYRSQLEGCGIWA